MDPIDNLKEKTSTKICLQLIDSNNAYFAFDTAEELEEMRSMAKKAKMPNWQYNAITRNNMKTLLHFLVKRCKQN